MTLEEVLAHPWIALNCTGSVAASRPLMTSFSMLLPSRQDWNSSPMFSKCQGENAKRLQQSYGGIL